MHRIRLLLCLFLSCTLSLGVQAQHHMVVDTSDQVVSSEVQVTGVVLHADPRLALLTKKQASIHRGLIYSSHGYRVQIYNGNDRAKATQIKIDFIRRFPGVHTYLTYVAPQYRVKVGDFQTRKDAEKMYEQVYSLYRPVMIVPDLIVVNTLKDD